MDKEVLETVGSIVVYLQSIDENLPQMISDYRMNHVQTALKDLADLAEGLIWLGQAMELTYELHGQSMHHLTDIYKGILSGMENEDYFLIADILEYELLPSLTECRERIREKLQDEMRSEGVM